MASLGSRGGERGRGRTRIVMASKVQLGRRNNFKSSIAQEGNCLAMINSIPKPLALRTLDGGDAHGDYSDLIITHCIHALKCHAEPHI